MHRIESTRVRVRVRVRDKIGDMVLVRGRVSFRVRVRVRVRVRASVRSHRIVSAADTSSSAVISCSEWSALAMTSPQGLITAFLE